MAKHLERSFEIIVEHSTSGTRSKPHLRRVNNAQRGGEKVFCYLQPLTEFLQRSLHQCLRCGLSSGYTMPSMLDEACSATESSNTSVIFRASGTEHASSQSPRANILCPLFPFSPRVHHVPSSRCPRAIAGCSVRHTFAVTKVCALVRFASCNASSSLLRIILHTVHYFLFAWQKCWVKEQTLG